MQIFIKKQPSPEKNPAIQCESIFTGRFFSDLITLTVLGKCIFNLLDTPLFKEAFKLITLIKPSLFKCSPLSIKFTIFFHKRKSVCF